MSTGAVEAMNLCRIDACGSILIAHIFCHPASRGITCFKCLLVFAAYRKKLHFKGTVSRDLGIF